MKKILQFSYRRNRIELPVDVPIIDCRVIQNPYSKSQTEAGRRALVRADRHFEELVERGIKHLQHGNTVAVGCEFGKHRSGAVAEEISERTGAKILNLAFPPPEIL